ncbi:glycosyltransferase family 2 protein [Microlunatus endophyticus]|nr:glycosyltransferase family 2 protein [Microlunatus endophyticus]
MPVLTKAPLVSLIVPVYNALPYLPDLLDSIDNQGLTDREFQVVLIDDGSTDGSSGVLDRFRRDRRNVQVLTQPNSGWPGMPRNRGLDVATGRWVFFADVDDYLVPRGLAELVRFGDQQAAEIVIPRVLRCGTRSGRRKFVSTQPSITKRQAFRTFTPHKLIDRQLIEANDLRFPEGEIRLEDGILLSRCYLLADKISVLADQDYYFFRGREDGQNISSRRIVPEAYVASLEKIAANVHELSRGPAMTRALIAEIIRRKVLRFYLPTRFPQYDSGRQAEWLNAHGAFLTKHADSAVRARLSEPRQRLLDCIIAGDVAAVRTEIQLQA